MDSQVVQSPRFAVYARSATNVACESSTTDQVNSCIAAAAKINPAFTLAERCVFTDEGVSGISPSSGRPGLSALMEQAAQRSRLFDHVFAVDTTRLSRNLAQSLVIVDHFKHHGVEVHFVSEGIRSSDPNFRTMFGVLAEMNYRYTGELSAKVRRSLQANAIVRRSMGSHCFGYTSHSDSPSNPTKVTFRIVDGEAATVRRIYRAFADGVSAPEIARALNDEQVPGPRDRNSERGGVRSWTSTQVYAILRQQRYRGTLLWGRTRTVLNPGTGKYEVRRQPESEVVRVAMHALSIVDADLARAVDEHLAAMSAEADPGA